MIGIRKSERIERGIHVQAPPQIPRKGEFVISVGKKQEFAGIAQIETKLRKQTHGGSIDSEDASGIENEKIGRCDFIEYGGDDNFGRHQSKITGQLKDLYRRTHRIK